MYINFLCAIAVWGMLILEDSRLFSRSRAQPLSLLLLCSRRILTFVHASDLNHDWCVLSLFVFAWRCCRHCLCLDNDRLTLCFVYFRLRAVTKGQGQFEDVQCHVIISLEPASSFLLSSILSELWAVNQGVFCSAFINLCALAIGNFC